MPHSHARQPRDDDDDDEEGGRRRKKQKKKKKKNEKREGGPQIQWTKLVAVMALGLFNIILTWTRRRDLFIFCNLWVPVISMRTG